MEEFHSFKQPVRRRLRAGLVVFALSLGIAMPVAAGQFEDAIAASDRGNYATAIQLLRPLAEQGNPRAEISLGYAYSQALGIPKDYMQAHMWFSRAAAHLPPGSVDRDTALLNRDAIAAKMTAAQIAQAQQLAQAGTPK
jgi:TPR repeat protein